MPAESSGNDAISTTSGLAAWIARTIGEKSVVAGG